MPLDAVKSPRFPTVMKKLPLVLLLLALFSPLHAAEKPNIILILADDLGWADVGCNGNDFIETPHIDGLAADGMRFTDFYAAGAVCSPTRASIQSGQNQARMGLTAHIPGHWRPFERVLTPVNRMAMATEIVTVGEALREAGYATGYIGKWHLGNHPPFAPQNQGYDFTVEIGGPHLPGRFRSRHPDFSPKPGQYRTDFEADVSEHFITENKEAPFFLIVSPYAVHIPLAAMSERVEKYQRKAEETGRDLPHPVYAAMVEHLDDMVGRIVAAVEENGLTDNTLIAFTSDNGGLYRRYDFNPDADDDVTTNAPLRGEKGQLYEGGIRVPLVVKWPKGVPAGSESDAVSISHDFYPTFVELAGGSLPENQAIDGVSLAGVLADPAAGLDREAIYFHYPHYHHDRPASAIREGDWKLIEYLDNTGEAALFNLAEDIGEENDLSEAKQGRVADLRKKLQAWKTTVAARITIPNPTYDPHRAGEWWSLRNGEPVDSQGRTRFPPTEKDG